MALFLTSQVINYSLRHCAPPPLPRPSSCFNKILPGCISRSGLMGKFTFQPPYVSFRHPSGCSRYEPHPLLLHCPAQGGQWVGAGSGRVAPPCAARQGGDRALTVTLRGCNSDQRRIHGRKIHTRSGQRSSNTRRHTHSHPHPQVDVVTPVTFICSRKRD